ncbi:MAG: 4-hydroxybenzoate octaprenyltransferase [Gammaproteobacteria bacterium]
MAFSQTLKAYAQLMRIERPIGVLLLLYPTLWALWVSAGGRPSSDVFIVFVLGVYVMRAAGCVINDYADRDIDGDVERTQARPLATKSVSPKEALLLFLALMAVALALVLYLDPGLLWLAIIGALLASIYPFMKRFTHLPQLFLGAAFGWAVPMSFAAHGQALAADCWWLFAATVCWAAAYDTAYAMVDRDDDIKIGVKSTAVLFGRFDRFAIFLFHAATLLALYVTGVLNGLGGWYITGLITAALLALYQQWLMRAREPKKCFDAFLNNNWFGAVVLFGLVLDYTLV